MKKLRSHNVGIDQGSLTLFSDFEHDGPMWTGEGPRRHETALRFKQAFRDPPTVHVGFSMWDMDGEPNQRAELVVEAITREGFRIVFQTWGDSRVARIGANWIAIGPMDDDLDWDVI